MCVLKDMSYDLEDLRMWEPVLFGAASKKQLILDVLKKKEKKMTSKINKDDEVCVFVSPLNCQFIRYNCLNINQSNPRVL